MFKGHIITQMEMRSLNAGFDTIWVVDTMMCSQLAATLLLRTYNKIYKTKVSHPTSIISYPDL